MISLFPYQQPSAEALLRSLRAHRVAVDASDTGTGKTFTAAHVAAQLRTPVAVICPKAVVPVWKRVLADAGVEPLFVTNYEKLRVGRSEFGRWNVKRFEWSLPADTLLIWDEVHRCKSPTSQNARMLIGAQPFCNLCLSATLAQDPTEMRAIGYLLGLHQNNKNFFKWCLANGCWRGPFGGLEFKKKTAQKHLLALHAQIFPQKGSRVRIADLGDAFPDNVVTAETYAFDNAEKVDAAYADAKAEIDRREIEGEPVQSAVLLMQARQKAEVLKADGLASMAQDLVAEGNSVVIFTSFRETLEKLCDKLKCQGVFGGQHDGVREVAISDFQSDHSRILVVNIQAGGVGISLHDMNGNYPRVSLILPTYHAIELKQALGRIHRAGAKSKAIQKIIFAAGTVEERICRQVKAKLHNVELLQDGDLAVEDECADASMRAAGFREMTPEESVAAQPFFECAENISKKVACVQNDSNVTSYNLNVASRNEPTMSADALSLSPAPDHGVSAASEVATRAHARFSPSTLKSKAVCPGFINDPDGDKSFADRGTRGHEAAEREDLSICGADEGLRRAAEMCINYKRRVINSYRVTPTVFQEIRLSYFDEYGYCDVLIHDGLTADLIDWKFSVSWYDADSPQFWAYCLGVFNELAVDTINVHVVHPFRDEVDLHTFTRASDYKRLSAQVSAIIKRAEKNDPADYAVSQQCHYCGLAGRCPKLGALGMEIARRYQPDLDLPAGSLHGSEIDNPETISTLLAIAPIVTKAAEGWKHRGLELWEQDGVAIPGYELAERKGSRSIASARSAFDVIKREIAPDLTAEQFVEFCDVKATAVDDLVKSVAKRGDKQKAVSRVNALLVDEEILSTGGNSRFLKATRK